MARREARTPAAAAAAAAYGSVPAARESVARPQAASKPSRDLRQLPALLLGPRCCRSRCVRCVPARVGVSMESVAPATAAVLRARGARRREPCRLRAETTRRDARTAHNAVGGGRGVKVAQVEDRKSRLEDGQKAAGAVLALSSGSSSGRSSLRTVSVCLWR